MSDTVHLEITGLSHDGAGIARLPAPDPAAGSGLVVFIPGALPGELVEAMVTETRPRSARARLLTVLRPSPDRLSPSASACSVAERCGGCSLGHLAYPAQLAFKTNRVAEALRRIGKLPDVPVSPCLASPLTEGYRNKMQFVVFVEPDSPAGPDGPASPVRPNPLRFRLGQYAPGTHDPVPAEDCRLAAPALRRVAHHLSAALTAWASRSPNPDATPGRPTAASPSAPRHAVLRWSAATGEVMVVLVTPTPAFPAWEELAADLLARAPEIKSLVQLVNPRPSGAVLTGRRARIAGRPYLVDRLGDLTLHLSPESFLQVNLAQTLPLYNLVREAAALDGSQEVLDVYCGIGTIALFLAPAARHVTGLEIVPAAVQDAAATARLNGLANADFLAGPAERLLPQLARRGRRPNVVVVDPPRAGVAPEALTAIAALRPGRLVYVSCDPETL
ncbi:MAG: 23S rRNA (uracil(1939)-C(5))-methyltransferase RlmD, partial [Methanocella sp.]